MTSTRWLKMIEKYGSEEAAKEYMKSIGKKGGEQNVEKGFAKLSKEKHLAISSKGGEASPKKQTR